MDESNLIIEKSNRKQFILVIDRCTRIFLDLTIMIYVHKILGFVGRYK